MGLPVSSDISADLLPVLIINIAMAIEQIKHAFQSFMQALGLLSAVPTPSDATSSTTFSEDYNFCSGLMQLSLFHEIRQDIPSTIYSLDRGTGAESVVDVECSVCLQEFQRGQEVYQLPVCKHVFHKGCFDGWLDHEQRTCPLCRNSLVPEEVFIKQQQGQRELFQELPIWFSVTHGLGSQGLWCNA